MHFLIFISDLLRLSFWSLILFAMDRPYLAVMTLLAMLWHEGFHVWALIREHASGALRTRLCGLRISLRGTVSYESERRIAAAGPIGGFIGAGICLLLTPLAGEYFLEFALCHTFTSLSNLLPIEGYDGYRILAASAALGESDGIRRALPCISFLLTGILTLLFLSVFGILGEGLWPAGAFLFTLLFSIREEKNTNLEDLEEKRRIREI